MCRYIFCCCQNYRTWRLAKSVVICFHRAVHVRCCYITQSCTQYSEQSSPLGLRNKGNAIKPNISSDDFMRRGGPQVPPPTYIDIECSSSAGLFLHRWIYATVPSSPPTPKKPHPALDHLQSTPLPPPPRHYCRFPPHKAAKRPSGVIVQTLCSCSRADAAAVRWQPHQLPESRPPTNSSSSRVTRDHFGTSGGGGCAIIRCRGLPVGCAVSNILRYHSLCL